MTGGNNLLASCISTVWDTMQDILERHSFLPALSFTLKLVHLHNMDILCPKAKHAKEKKQNGPHYLSHCTAVDRRGRGVVLQPLLAAVFVVGQLKVPQRHLFMSKSQTTSPVSSELPFLNTSPYCPNRYHLGTSLHSWHYNILLQHPFSDDDESDASRHAPRKWE